MSARALRVALLAAVVFLLATALLLLLLPANADAADYWSVGTIYNDESHVEMGTGNVWGFAFGHQRVVWSRADPDQAASGILMQYDLASGETAVVPEGASVEPMQDVMGRYLTWFRYNNFDPEPRRPDIRLYDLLEDRMVYVTDDVIVDTAPRIWGDRVVWERRSGDTDIWAYDIDAEAAASLPSSAAGDHGPAISGEWVAWEMGEGIEREIMVYNLLTGASRTVTHNHVADHDPIVAGEYLIWLQGAHGSTEIFLEDIVTGRGSRITTNSVEEHSLKVAGNKIAWVEDRDSASEICLYDIPGRTTARLTDNDVADMSVDLDGTYVVWQRYSDGDWEIMVHNSVSGSTNRFTDNSLQDVDPAIDNGRMVWRCGNEDWTVPHAVVVEWDVKLACVTLFADVPHTRRYFTAINGLGGAGYVGGYSLAGGGREFRPDSSLLRAQFAKMICETLELRVTENQTCPFLDVGPDAADSLYPHEYVGAAAGAGIIRGTAPGQFSPYVDVSRAQVVTMIVRAAAAVPGFHFDEPSPGYAGTLGDFDETHGSNMLVAEYNGLLAGLDGYGSGWDPWAPATRGETAQLLWNLLKLF